MTIPQAAPGTRVRSRNSPIIRSISGNARASFALRLGSVKTAGGLVPRCALPNAGIRRTATTAIARAFFIGQDSIQRTTNNEQRSTNNDLVGKKPRITAGGQVPRRQFSVVLDVKAHEARATGRR